MAKSKRTGRPRKPPGEKYVKVTVSIPPDKAAIAQMRGGSRSKAVDLPAIRRGILKALTSPAAVLT